MIKRIIFDIDETIIHNKKPWVEVCKDFLESQNIACTENMGNELATALDEYESTYNYYDEAKMIHYLKGRLSYPIPENFDFLNDGNLSDKIELFPNVAETLSYLSSKYELIILSNWTSKTQLYRLDYLDIKKFFKECYFPEDFPRKPDRKAFEIAMGGYKPEECLMIGDSLEIDLKTPHQMGMHTLLFDPNHKYYNPFTESFKDYKGLKEML